MPYEPLAKIFHRDTSPSRFNENDRLARARLEADATFRTGIVAPTGELFLAVPRELSLLNEGVLRRERGVAAAFDRLPRIARRAVIMDVIAGEVVWTNELENIRSTRRQIGELLVAHKENPSPSRKEQTDARRFKELALLYLELSNGICKRPATPEDIRAIYDRVMEGEPLDGLRPDGRLFRRDPVDIVGAGGRVVHSGVTPESAIIDTLQRMLDLVTAGTLPDLYAAAVAHYVFEYAHPFYDGNGRTGRYLLALYLSEPLSLITSLSLSRAIAERKDAYYRSFRTVEDPLNHGELTFFVLEMLGSIERAQEGILADLERKESQLVRVAEKIPDVAERFALSDKEAVLLDHFAQIQLFAPLPDVTLGDVSAWLGLGEKMARARIGRLEDAGLVHATQRRPLRFALTPQALGSLGLETSENEEER